MLSLVMVVLTFLLCHKQHTRIKIGSSPENEESGRDGGAKRIETR